jgi:hypothetical protein
VIIPRQRRGKRPAARKRGQRSPLQAPALEEGAARLAAGRHDANGTVMRLSYLSPAAPAGWMFWLTWNRLSGS